MEPSRRKPVAVNNDLAQGLRSKLWVAVIIHWCAQAMFHMDPTERWLKAASSFVGTGLLWAVIGSGLAGLASSFVIAHSLNFLLNGQLNVVLKNFGISRTNQDGLMHYLDGLRTRLITADSIRYAAAYGSLARCQLKRTSDLDVRLIREPGVAAAVRGFAFVAAERSRAAFVGVPLDILLLDSARGLKAIRREEIENAIVLKQSQRKQEGRP